MCARFGAGGKCGVPHMEHSLCPVACIGLPLPALFHKIISLYSLILLEVYKVTLAGKYDFQCPENIEFWALPGGGPKIFFSLTAGLTNQGPVGDLKTGRPLR
jgi:hypothetical protein